MRFVVPAWCDEAATEFGIFHFAYDVARHDRTPCWIRAELGRELAWFGRSLDVPDRLARRFRRRRTIRGVCWFRPEAGEHIARARYMGWLMSEAGCPVEQIRTRYPGEVIWRDAHQIVARPGADVPRAFH